MIGFIVTSHITTPLHLSLLEKCIASIQEYYPQHHIYVLDDHSPMQNDVEALCKESDNVSLHLTEFKAAGELNPYLFILSEECKHETLVYIHDSVSLRNTFEVPSSLPDICPLWTCDKFVFADVYGRENNEILNNLMINAKPIRSLLRTHEKDLFVTFGAMSVFTRTFASKMMSCSNLQDVAPLFKSRPNRCLFERVLSLVMMEVFGCKKPGAICGDILNHPYPFLNKDPCIDTDKPFVKVWVGR